MGVYLVFADMDSTRGIGMKRKCRLLSALLIGGMDFAAASAT